MVAETGARLLKYGSPVSLALLAVLTSGAWKSRRGGMAGGSKNGMVPPPASDGVLCGVVATGVAEAAVTKPS